MTQLLLPFLDESRNEDEDLRQENAKLRAENARLRALLAMPPRVKIETADTAIAAEPIVATVRETRTNYHSSQLAHLEKQQIELFLSLFKGRDDVHAVRWTSKAGHSGYSPARRHDWDNHTRDPKTKKQVCGAGCKQLPMTAETIRCHLSEDHVVGIYPLLPDETCWLLAVDFDKSTWEEDVSAFLDACVELKVPAALERSRSGNGGHVWIFFEKPIVASQARKLGATLITRCREKRYQLSLDSYDRMFPNQDTMPKGQFGNLIALPLQHGACQQGNSLFVDRNFQPFSDQWQFLNSIERTTASQVNRIVREAQQANAVIPVRRSSADESEAEDPWTIPPSGRAEDNTLPLPLPGIAQITVSNMLYVDKAGFSSGALSRLMNIAAFQNPEFYKYQAMRMSTFGKPRIISCAEDFQNHIGLPRGMKDQLTEILAANKVKFEVLDKRIADPVPKMSFTGKLRSQQKEAAQALLQHDVGVLSAATAFGKTVVAAYCIAKRRTNTLILVHRAQLLDQWIERLSSFLNIPAKSIGHIGGGKTKRTGQIDVATIQSLQRKGVVKDLVAEYGYVIVDECHHIPAFTFEQVLRQTKAKYVLGLTATPVRKDGHHPIVIMQCGPIRFKVDARDRQDSDIVEHLVVPRHTQFELAGPTGDIPIQDLYAMLAADEARNDLLFNDILQSLEEKRSPLIITERTDHLEKLEGRLRSFAKNLIVFRGGLSKKQRAALMEQVQSIPDSEERLILATGRYIGEGFDDARLDTLFLAMPISWRGTLQQYAGRLHRNHADKSVVRIFDYVDARVSVFSKMYERRLKGYKTIGYQITEPKSI